MKNSKLVPVVLAVIIGIGVLSVVFQENGDTSGGQQQQSGGAPQNISSVAGKLSLNRTDFDFGNIPIHGGKVSTSFTVTNESDQPVTLTKVTTSCMCTDATIEGKTFGLHMDPTANIVIEPKSSKEVLVTFDPLAHGDKAVGPVTRVVAITTNSSATPNLMFKFAGNVVNEQ